MTSDLSAGALDLRQAFWLILWSLALFVAVLVLDTRQNEFPYFYYPDEPAEVDQVVTSHWNYHDPMLLLSATKAVAGIMRLPSREQSIVVAGRWVSAAFTAVAVVAFALLAYAWRGWTASFGTGLSLMLHHQLCELGHFMTDDPALLMGVALTFLTAYAFWFKPNGWWALLLGVSVALAISGKYVGIAVLGIAVPVLLRAGERGERKRRWIYFAGALAITLLAVNLPLLPHFGMIRESLGREIQSAAQGQRGVPHARYWGIFRDNSTLVMRVLLIVFLAARWRERRRLPLVIWLLIAFPFACTLALSFWSKSNYRYFLPVSACLTFLAALGVLDAAKYLSKWMQYRWALAGTAAALVISQIPGWMTCETAFERDDNADLLEWVKTEAPADAVIAKDSNVQLPAPGDSKDEARFGPLTQKVLSERYAADVGSIEKMRALGVTLVAVSNSDYEFRLRNRRPPSEDAVSFARRKEFYDNLLRDGELLFERERGAVLYLHPGIRVYRLPLTGK
jgi:hypothetical protein